MNLRLTFAAGVAVLLASLSLNAVLAGNGWLAAGVGAVIVVAGVGLVTRMSWLPSVLTATFLALIVVLPLLFGQTWLERTAGLAIVVATAASATGARLLRGFATLVSYLGGLLIYLNLVFAGAASLWYVIPTQHSLARLEGLCRDAFSRFAYAPPVGDYRSVSLVAAGGIGLIAIVVDIIAVRLRRPAVAGLPLLLLFSVPVASNIKAFGATQIVTFMAGLTGFLALLAADGRQRVRMWGRLVTFRYVQPADEAGSGPDTRELAASGRRIGLAAMCLAVVVPLVLPSVRPHDVFGTTDDGIQSGVSSTFDALLEVQDNLSLKQQPVLSYTTTSADPRLQYLQQYVLNYSPSVNDWLIVPGSQTLALEGLKLPFKAPGFTSSTPTTTVTTTVHLSKDQHGEAVLPVPYAPVSLATGLSGWLESSNSLMVFNPELQLANLNYIVVSQEPDPTARQISYQPAPAAIASKYGSYTGPDEQRLLNIAAAHAVGATPFQQAVALQNWFLSGQFTYSLKTKLPKTNWLLTFLTSEKRGVCTQFAWAFAVLARLVGIPSRIAVGYTAGTPGPDKTWQVTTADSHAWPELYFTGYGWLRFEPTPGSAQGGQGTAIAPSYATGPPRASGKSASGKSAAGNSGPHPTTAGHRKGSGLSRITRPDFPGPGQASQAQGSGVGFAIGIPVALFLLLAWPALTRQVTRRRRWLAASGDAGLAHAAWLELSDDLADYGLAGEPGETPRAVARRVAAEASLNQPAMQAITRIGAAEERARYARTAKPGRGLAADVATVRKSLAASVPRGQRVRALLMPPSTLMAARRLTQRMGDWLGWLDSPLPSVQRRLRRTVPHRSG